MFGSLFIPVRIALRNGTINLFGSVRFKLHIEIAVRFSRPRKDHHAGCGFIETMDDNIFPNCSSSILTKCDNFFPSHQVERGDQRVCQGQ